MLKMINVLFLSALLATGLSAAAELGTADEAIAMVDKATTYLAKNGRDKTLVEINKPNGAFVDRDLYVVVHDMTGKVLANPVLPRMVGKDIKDIKDVDGKAFVRERLAKLEKSEKGWIDFKWPNSLTQKIDVRSAYFVRVGDLVFTCGIVKK